MSRGCSGIACPGHRPQLQMAPVPITATATSALEKASHQEQFVDQQDNKMPLPPAEVQHVAAVTSCFLGWIFLIHLPGWKRCIFCFLLHKVPEAGKCCVWLARDKQTLDNFLLNHWFSWRLLAAGGDILGRDMGADPHLCVHSDCLDQR